MRVVTAASSVLLLLACDSSPGEPEPPPRPSASPEPASKPLVHGRVQIDVPAGFVALDEKQTRRLHDAAIRGGSVGTSVEVRGRRAPEGLRNGIVYIQSGKSPLAVEEPASVREVLTQQFAEYELEFQDRGVNPGTVVRKEREGGLEVCSESAMARGGREAVLQVCTLAYLASPHEVTTDTVGCVAPPDSEFCRDAIRSRKYSASKALPLDGRWQPEPKPLVGVADDRFGQLAWGTNLGRFRKQCREAGHVVDRLDPGEPDYARKWLKDGLMSGCEGLPGSKASESPLGKVLRTHALFHRGQMCSATLYMQSECSRVTSTLARAYPYGFVNRDRSVHWVDKKAKGKQIVTIASARTQQAGARCSVTIQAECALRMPPLPGLPPIPGLDPP